VRSAPRGRRARLARRRDPDDETWLVSGVIEAEAALHSRLDLVRDSVYRAAPSRAWLSSLALYGALLNVGLVGWLLVGPLDDARVAATRGRPVRPGTR
jgi:hypothetical protein